MIYLDSCDDIGLWKRSTQDILKFYFAFMCTYFIADVHEISWVTAGLVIPSSQLVNLQKQMKSFCKFKWIRNLKEKKNAWAGLWNKNVLLKVFLCLAF